MTRAAPLVALLLAAALAPAPARAQDDDPPSLSAGRVAGQVGAGVLLTPIGFVAGGKATEWAAERLGASDPRASRVALVGAWSGAALASAAGPALVGARGPGSGSYGAAVAGAVAGGVGSWALVRLGNRLFDRDGDDGRKRPCRLSCALVAGAAVVLPSVGATVGYEISRRRR